MHQLLVVIIAVENQPITAQHFSLLIWCRVPSQPDWRNKISGAKANCRAHHRFSALHRRN